MLTAAMLDRRWPHAPHSLVDGIAATADAVLGKYDITTPLRLAHFLAQISEETGGGTALEENLHYSAERAHVVWPSRFPTVAAAMPYAGNPRLLADRVYGGRMGNRTGTDDGWNYRGRGLIQLTGHDLYAEIGKICGLDLVAHPEFASDPGHCLEVAAAYWKRAGVNADADRDDLRTETERVNGGLTNLAARHGWLVVWKHELAAAVTPGTAPAAPAPAALPQPTLQLGSEGPEVQQLQHTLAIAVNGAFGAATKEAVETFQRTHELTPDGIVGPKTRAALGALAKAA